MEQVKLGYSTKNIPIPSKREYSSCLIEKTRQFLKNVTWRAYFTLNPKPTTAKQTFGFNSSENPPRVPELKDFQDCMIDLIQNIEFKNSAKKVGKFQHTLNNDLKKLKKDTELLVPADKTSNHYKVPPSDYKTLLNQNIQKDYKKAVTEKEKDITKLEKSIAKSLELADRIETVPKTEAFVTLKDHKDNFMDKPTCRLINPNKCNTGKISKQILQEINLKLRSKLKLSQWRNTTEVIDWFKAIPTKDKHTFIQFDIVDFYPSITKELLDKAIEFAAEHTNISEEYKHIIKSTKQNLLYCEGKPWVKKGDSEVDVTMGSWDGAEVCELVGLYLLFQLLVLKLLLGLYRDDGLAAFRGTAREAENIKKKICKIFSDNGLRITISTNTKVVNFLDVTFNLSRDIFSPFMKPNNPLMYVNVQSNHPPLVLKNIPKGINYRLSSISSNKEVFDNAKGPYQDALNKAGYDFELHFDPQASKLN